MRKINARKAAMPLVAVGALALGLNGVAGAGAASKHKVKVKLVGTLDSKLIITGTAKGKPFGNCKNKAKLIIPKNVGKFTCKGGTIKYTAIGTTGGANEAKGSWKITSGTGKFKGAKGKGKFSGLQSTGTFTYTGTVTY